jgi:hypothetical protein
MRGRECPVGGAGRREFGRGMVWGVMPARRQTRAGRKGSCPGTLLLSSSLLCPLVDSKSQLFVNTAADDRGQTPKDRS